MSWANGIYNDTDVQYTHTHFINFQGSETTHGCRVSGCVSQIHVASVHSAILIPQCVGGNQSMKGNTGKQDISNGCKGCRPYVWILHYTILRYTSHQAPVLRVGPGSPFRLRLHELSTKPSPGLRHCAAWRSWNHAGMLRPVGLVHGFVGVPL